MLKAAICTIGDEILIGQIIDTNSSEISQALNCAGVKVEEMLSVGDNREQIFEALKRLTDSYDIVITTGGLGPTKDDITKKILAELTGAKSWHTDERQRDIIESILTKRNIPLSQNNLDQALVPDSCEVIPNRLGTAPVMKFKIAAPARTSVLFSLPGVPHEAVGALPDIIESIRSEFSLSSIYHRTIVTYGIAESTLSNMISEWEDSLPDDMRLAYLPNPAIGVRLRLSIYGGNREDEERRINEEFAKLKPILGDAIYSYDDETLESAVGRLLKSHSLTMSAAESCTGGTISEMITSVPGASEYYLGSVTSYANSVKRNILGVNGETIDSHGAVSEECVREMAEGVKRVTGSDFSVATSGIAGPGGAEPGKPVGLVWIAVSSPDRTISRKFVFSSDRKRNIQRFASSAINMLRLEIQRYTSENE